MALLVLLAATQFVVSGDQSIQNYMDLPGFSVSFVQPKGMPKADVLPLVRITGDAISAGITIRELPNHIKQMEHLLQTKGYHRVRITYEVKIEQERFVIVVFKIDATPPTRVAIESPPAFMATFVARDIE